MSPYHSDRARNSTKLSSKHDGARLKAFAVSRDAIVFADNDGRCVDVNPAAEAIFGLTAEQLIGRLIMDFMEPEMKLGQVFEEFKKNGFFKGEHRLVRADGEIIDVESYGVANIQPGLHLSVIRDISDRSRLERILDITNRKRAALQQELTALTQSLEQQVAERTAEIKQSSEQLRLLASELTKTEQRERQRLAEVLHESLQQILVASKHRLALIERTPDSKQLASEVAGIIDEAIATCRSLTAELSPPILRQNGLIAGLEWLCRWVYDKHGLKMNLDVRETSLSLPQDLLLLLFQAARELLFNVVKHAGVKTARLEVIQEENQIRVTVKDDGIGFDQSRLRASGGHDQGFGLFSLSERIKTIGGQMTIDSALDHGSRISLVVPVPEAITETMPKMEAATGLSEILSEGIQASESEGKKYRIVLVDDHMVMRQGLARLFQKERDIEIVGEASDGESAVKLIRQLKPDIVLMDISMPKLDGIQATRIIHSEMPDIRVIGMSMFEEGEQAAAMREAGAIGYITKSGPSEAVIEIIRTCVSIA